MCERIAPLARANALLLSHATTTSRSSRVSMNRAAPRGAIALFSSVLADFVSNYQREVYLARRLAEAGLLTLRYHPSGMGDSDGDPGRVTLKTLDDDAAWATQLLAAAAGDVPMGFVGMRWGALAPPPRPGRAASNAPPWCSSSRHDFRRYFREAWRIGRLCPHRKRLCRRQEPEAQDVSPLRLGCLSACPSMPPLTQRDRARCLAEFDASLRRPARAVPSRELRPDHRAIVERLRANGASVDTSIVDVEESWWFRSGPKVVLHPELNEQVATWLASRLNGSGTADDHHV